MAMLVSEQCFHVRSQCFRGGVIYAPNYIHSNTVKVIEFNFSNAKYLYSVRFLVASTSLIL